tara:strand:- start:396 stop:758 length:363 start_codon:yes stop_codon:yes gene_type:complete
MTKLVMAMVILVISNIFAWWQLNGQFYFKENGIWFWHNPMWMATVLGIPIGYMFWWSTKLSYEHFGTVWNIRMIGFGVGTIIFGILSWAFLEEIPTLKTIICILLAVAIILIQVTNLVGE